MELRFKITMGDLDGLVGWLVGDSGFRNEEWGRRGGGVRGKCEGRKEGKGRGGGSNGKVEGWAFS